ncbi:MAG TPA: phage holin family protein [Candidatus Dormibacteraeota bacterium]|nr:phage holin family protein [Candidatus Dormibacteraeota bacterium]
MVSPEVPEQTVVELVHSLTDDVRQLVTDELALAKAELKGAVRRAIRIAIGAVVALLGVGLFLIFALVTLVEWQPNHTLVAGVVGAVGLVLLLLGSAVIWANRRLWPFKETRASLEGDLEWARRLSKRARP